MEGTPFVLVAPMTFWMLAQSPEDYYERFPLGSFFRLIRLIALFIVTFLPSLNFHDRRKLLFLSCSRDQPDHQKVEQVHLLSAVVIHIFREYVSTPRIYF